MAVFAWIFIGLIVGNVAGRRFHHKGVRLMLNVALGVIGALAGGYALATLGFQEGTPLLVAGGAAALAGSIALIASYRVIAGAV